MSILVIDIIASAARLEWVERIERARTDGHERLSEKSELDDIDRAGRSAR